MYRPVMIMLCALAASTCADDESTQPPPPPEPVFVMDWQTAYTEVRDCRRSPDHDLRYIRILADAAALGPYNARDMPFPEGAVVFKAEYAEPDCSTLESLTAMRREDGFDPAGGDWHWQRATPEGVVERDGKLDDCRTCHLACGVAPDGFDGTCSAP